MRSVPALTMVGGLLVAGCAGTSFSRLDGNRYYKAAIDTYPVTIVRVDDASELRNPVSVEPGVHGVTVQAPPGGAHRYGEQQTLTLDVKPCMRYWLVAVKDGPLSSKFAVKVDHQEPIGGCRPPT